MMNDVVSTFPLLRLPNMAIQNALRIMNLRQMFGVSLLSRKTKNLVKSLKLAPSSFYVEVTGCFRVYLKFGINSMICFELYQVLENEPLQEIGTPEAVHLLHDQEWVKWKNSMSVTQLLDHFQFILNSSKASLFFKENCERFSHESIYKNVKDFKCIGFSSRNQEHNRKILNLFQPEHIFLNAQALDDFRVHRDILIQNFDVVKVFAVRIALDDLLMANIRCIYMYCLRLSMKTLNQFLKLWTRGSNSRLECLFLEFPEVLRFEELFTVLKYQHAPPNSVRRFKASGYNTPLVVANGRDIWRHDGTKATILLGARGNLVRFGFYVWHDYCVMN